ncbi:MAG: trypsin-like serine protease [Rhodobacteraceae bacterium]|nr:trypsin-like serine protease [Paracoccaceae bacterium]
MRAGGAAGGAAAAARRRGAALAAGLAAALAVAPAGGSAAEGPLAGLPPAVGWFGAGTRPAAGQGSCTATLVAPDLILTAGHCVPGGPDAARAIGGYTFLAGWAGGRAAAGARAVAVIRPAPDPDRDGTLGGDVVLVRLNRQVAAAEAAPLPLAQGEPAPGSAVTTLGYPIAAPAAPVRQADCPVRQAAGGVLALGCPSEGGFSGGPVLVPEAGGWRLAGVMVARGRGNGAAGTYAVTVPADLRRRIAPGGP